MQRPSIADLARARVESAERLEAAIAALGKAYDAYDRATTALEFKVNLDLARYLEAPIVIHLAARGNLTPYLERKLIGTPANLRALVEEQHRRSSVPALRA